MLLRPLTFHAPRTILEAAQLQATLEEARILAGGTFLLNSLKLMKRKGSKTPSHVISLRKIDELKGIEIKGDKMLIKAMTIINDLYDSPLLTHNTDILRKVCKNISTNPIRNMATVGGNLTCRYTWTEMGSVMVALEADMHFIGQDGKEEVVSAENFFKNAAKTEKIFSHVSIPINKDAKVAYTRVKKSANVDIPLLAVCIKTTFKDKRFTNTRVSVNNGTSFAQRDHKLEDFLNTQTVHDKIEFEALDHLDTEIYDKRSDDYKKHMFRISIKNALLEIIAK
ncbi:MAG: FAD binding domain-containing protein [Candidatus Omnitrophica bacterium]|nr:FAD binding domain-containing protein [Candidatus Omnitrophota bacterium]